MSKLARSAHSQELYRVPDGRIYCASIGSRCFPCLFPMVCGRVSQNLLMERPRRQETFQRSVGNKVLRLLDVTRLQYSYMYDMYVEKIRKGCN